MAKKTDKQPEAPVEQEEQIPVQEEPMVEEPPCEEAPVEPTELEKAKAEQAAEHERYLLLAAEYDNFRKRSQREKDEIYHRATADVTKKFLPIYDNLLRALQNETADEAYKKGVEMTMNELKKILASMGIEPFGEVGETFDPNKHNAVMHTEDESLGENVIAELFQTGFAMGDKIIRFAMVKVAN
jgi:molecular chaperone GrpE